MVQTVDVDTQAVRMRSRYIKGLDPTFTAKAVLRHTGIEGIGSQGALAREQAEILVRHEQMQEPAHRTNTAIALCRFDIGWRFDLELHFATMAAATMSRHVKALLHTAI